MKKNAINYSHVKDKEDVSEQDTLENINSCNVIDEIKAILICKDRSWKQRMEFLKNFCTG
jgi:hypothetical protein